MEKTAYKSPLSPFSISAESERELAIIDNRLFMNRPIIIKTAFTTIKQQQDQKSSSSAAASRERESRQTAASKKQIRRDRSLYKLVSPDASFVRESASS